MKDSGSREPLHFLLFSTSLLSKPNEDPAAPQMQRGLLLLCCLLRDNYSAAFQSCVFKPVYSGGCQISKVTRFILYINILPGNFCIVLTHINQCKEAFEILITV